MKDPLRAWLPKKAVDLYPLGLETLLFCPTFSEIVKKNPQFQTQCVLLASMADLIWLLYLKHFRRCPDQRRIDDLISFSRTIIRSQQKALGFKIWRKIPKEYDPRWENFIFAVGRDLWFSRMHPPECFQSESSALLMGKITKEKPKSPETLLLLGLLDGILSQFRTPRRLRRAFECDYVRVRAVKLGKLLKKGLTRRDSNPQPSG